MAENTNRPTSAKLYQSPSDSSTRPGTSYVPPGVPASREPEPTLGVRRNPQAHTTEPASAPPRAPARPRKAPPQGSGRIPPIGSVVEHRTSGQRGVVEDHRAHGYGTAVPQVRWAGEDHSWPQGVSANALRVVGSTPEDLYTYNQDATSGRPLRGSTGAA